MRLRDEFGQVLPVVTVMSLGLLAMVGLVIDAGVIFAARRDLQAEVDAAARAGAGILDESVYRQTRGREAVLDPAGAELATRERLADLEITDLRASSEAVFVRAARPQTLVILSFLGLDSIRVEAHSTARPRTGILAPGG